MQAARQAGALLKKNEKNISAVSRKSDNSLVTNLDSEAETLISTIIRSHFPSHGILGEESGGDATDSEYLWIIDPLDGTHNYIRGIGLYGVSIGVVRNDEFIAGVIFIPPGGLLYSAEAGSGAYCNGERVRVSACDSLERCTTTFDSCVADAEGLKLRVLQSLAPKVFNVRMFGASVINFACLAAGQIDAVIEFDDAPWDFAAGVCLVREAGGIFSSMRGEPLTCRTKGYIASAQSIHEALCAHLRAIVLQK
jgi:myo-inositol-1(or 4)-monophosphatase